LDLEGINQESDGDIVPSVGGEESGHIDGGNCNAGNAEFFEPAADFDRLVSFEVRSEANGAGRTPDFFPYFFDIFYCFGFVYDQGGFSDNWVHFIGYFILYVGEFFSVHSQKKTVGRLVPTAGR